MDAKRKIDAMHRIYGRKDGEVCKSCCNFIRLDYHGEKYGKCYMYGLSHSPSTDWAMRNIACGMHNVPFNSLKHNQIMNVVSGKHNSDEQPLEGQERWF